MEEDCTVYRTAGFIGKRWTLYILLELHKGRAKWKRFLKLKKTLPNITAKILSARLKELGKEGMVEKKVDSRSFPIKTRYALTRSGEDFISIIKSIKKWALKWRDMREACEKLDCKECDL